MKAARLHVPGIPLVLEDVPEPVPGPDELLLRVKACGVCRTDLHVVDGELPDPRLPLIPGHEVVGEIVAVGRNVHDLRPGERVGVPWLGWTCGKCVYCKMGQENLCERAQFTGYTRDGGYAEFMVAAAGYTFPLPHAYDDLHAAPLLCAGLIGYRALRLAAAAQRIGFYGFGAAAHILVQVARLQGRETYAFVRSGDVAALEFALAMGADWAGDSSAAPPVLLDAAIIFAPVGALVPAALRAVRKGGTVVCAGIHMSDIPSFPYSLLWHERVLRSVANLTRQDGAEFFKAIEAMAVRTEIEPMALAEANLALDRLRAGQIKGAAVLVP